jgi:hypothetical protein
MHVHGRFRRAGLRASERNRPAAPIAGDDQSYGRTCKENTDNDEKDALVFIHFTLHCLRFHKLRGPGEKILELEAFALAGS